MITKAIDLGPTKLGRIRQLTEELNSDELAIHLFFNLAPDLFCIADSNIKLQKVNHAWKLMLGWTEDELLNLPLVELVHADDIYKTEQIMMHMASNDMIRFHNRLIRKPGTINRINEPDGRPAGNKDYIVLEWNATTWENGLIYAVARQVPISCAACPDAALRFNCLQRNIRNNGTKNSAK